MEHFLGTKNALLVAETGDTLWHGYKRCIFALTTCKQALFTAIFRWICTASNIPIANDCNVMFVVGGREPCVAFSHVGVNCHAKLYRLLNEVRQAFGGYIRDAFQSDAPDCSTVFLCSRYYDEFLLDLIAR